MIEDSEISCSGATSSVFKPLAIGIMAAMFLRSTTRKKNGKQHRYFSIVENKRLADGRVVQRHVLYLGEINWSQELRGANRSKSLKRGKTSRAAL